MNTESKKHPALNLEAIEASIKANCQVNPQATKHLTLIKAPGPIKNIGVGRLLFVYLSLRAENTPEDIRDYIGMRDEEFQGKVRVLPSLYLRGKYLFEFEPTRTEDRAVYFYRKLLLTTNYILFKHKVSLLS